MERDIFLNKSDTVRRCIERIHEEYGNDDRNLYNFTKQDSMILNLQRACEACIDLAMHIVAVQKLGVPQSSRDAFDFLEQRQIINQKTAASMKAMVGFRNIAVHDYQKIQIPIIKNIITNHLDDFIAFLQQIKDADRTGSGNA